MTPEQQKAFDDWYLSDANPINRVLPQTAKRNRLAAVTAEGPQQTRGIGNETWDEVTGRYQQRGADLQHRTGPVLDETQANQSRAMQLGALDMLRRQGSGEAPSAAEVYAQRANQQAVMGAGQAVTGARTMGGALATLRSAGQQAGNAMLAGNAQNAAARAGEISHGQGAFAQGAGTLRGGDITAAGANATLEAQQRARNEAAQQNYESMAAHARTQEMEAGRIAQQTQNQRIADVEAIDAQKQANEQAAVGGFVSNMASVGSGAIAASQAAALAKKKKVGA
jgi:hypothetical protein